MSKQRPVTLEKRKSLLYTSNKRRSVSVIVGLSLAALVAGLVIAFMLRHVVEIDALAPALQPNTMIAWSGKSGEAIV